VPIWFILGREPDFDRLVPTGQLGSSIPTLRLILNKYIFWRLKIQVYTLWKKTFLPTITTPQLVIEKMTSGADLMIPGVISIIPSHAQELPLPLDSLVCVRPYQGTSRAPVAVGRMAVSSSEITEDAKGKAVVTLHTYRDALWERGSKSDPPEQVDAIGEDIPTAHIENEGSSEPGPSGTPAEAPVPELTPQEVDALLRQSLLYYIRATLASASSPLQLPASTLYSDGILPSRPSAHPALNQINIKLSSYKKLKPFLKAMEKEGILKLKETAGDLVVMTVDAAHPDVVGVGKWRTVGEEERKQKAREVREAENSGKTELLEVKEVYKPIGAVVSLFEAVGAKYVWDSRSSLCPKLIGFCRPTELYTAQALRDDVFTPYITTKNLIHPLEKKYIVLDDVLKTALLTKKEPDVEYLPRDKALERLAAACQAWYEVGREGKMERRRVMLRPNLPN
jgi:translation initiation factor 2D